jgi:dienelactone hydrolase
MGAYSEEIVFVPSEDQRLLAGVIMRPTSSPRNRRRPLGVICLHGAGGHFYIPQHVILGRELAKRGYLVVSGNTRGHDVTSFDTPWPATTRPVDVRNFRPGGNGWERWDEGPYDVAGWISFLVTQGVEQIVLFGRSLGVARITFYLAQRQDPRVVGLILASGDDRVLSHDPTRVQVAEQMVAEGRGDGLLPPAEDQPVVFAMESAAHLVHWERVFGPFVAAGHTPWIGSIRVPVLATVGAAEADPTVRTALDDMRARAVGAPRFDIQVIAGADHLYTGRERELAACVGDWLDALLAQQAVRSRQWWGGRKRLP